jgi:spermidine synthase
MPGIRLSRLSSAFRHRLFADRTRGPDGNSWTQLERVRSPAFGTLTVRSDGERLQLLTDGRISSSVYGNDGFPTAMYAHCFFLTHALHEARRFRRVLMVGGGGYCLPTYIARHEMAGEVTTVEIDTTQFGLAQRFFGAPPTGRKYRVVHADIAKYLKTDRTRYDVVFVDIGWHREYSRIAGIPADTHIKTTLATLGNAVADDGFAIVNFMSTIDSAGQAWLSPWMATLKRIFPTVIAVGSHPDRLHAYQDVTFVCSRNPFVPEDIAGKLATYRALPTGRAALVRRIASHIIWDLSQTAGPVNADIVSRLDTWQGQAESDSMLPLIAIGDTVRFRRAAAVKPLDIIAFRRKDGRIGVHRVVGIDQKAGTVTTKGDNLPFADLPVAFADILGIAVSVRKTLTDRTIPLESGVAVLAYRLMSLPLLRPITIRMFASHKLQRIAFGEDHDRT